MLTNNKQKMAGQVFLLNMQNQIQNQIFLPYPSTRNHFGIKSCSYQPQKLAFLLNVLLSKTCSNVELFSIFSQTYNFRDQNKNNVIETTSGFVYQLSEKYCVYYVYEHLKYCTQINKYWLNKNVSLNIV